MKTELNIKGIEYNQRTFICYELRRLLGVLVLLWSRVFRTIATETSADFILLSHNIPGSVCACVFSSLLSCRLFGEGLSHGSGGEGRGEGTAFCSRVTVEGLCTSSSSTFFLAALTIFRRCGETGRTFEGRSQAPAGSHLVMEGTEGLSFGRRNALRIFLPSNKHSSALEG